ncbi:MAG: hypothetical protein JNG83_08470 [Opitutaceae bacterium]|nr:hypothetical protein [Opitutaceae bacterium]
MTPPPAIASRAWLGALLAGFALLCLPLLLSDRETNYTFDEASYHLPAVRQIRGHWPALDLERDSLSATAPGYHYALATASLATGTGRLPLRLLNLGVSLGLLLLLWRLWPEPAAPLAGLLAVAPLAASNFFVKSAAYVVTDNAALLAAAGALAALCFAPAGRGPAVGGVLAAASILVRQNGAWLLAPLGMRILGEPRRRQQLPWLLPPLAVAAGLVLSWGGLVPPAWRELTRPAGGFVPAAGAYLLATLALLAPAYYAAARPDAGPGATSHRTVLAGAALGLAFALAGPNLPDHAAGRWGGYLWNAAERLPALGGHSVVFLLLAPAGGALLALLGGQLWRAAGRGPALVWLAAFGGWAAACLANRQVFHRYYEPTLLLLLFCWLVLVLRARPAGPGCRPAPLALLAAAQLLLTLVTAHGRTFGLL